jgi:ATP-dependent Lon protease
MPRNVKSPQIKDSKKKEKQPQKRKSRPDHDDSDDSSIDSRGNIRGLIVSSDSESEMSESPESSWRESSSSSEKPRRKEKAKEKEKVKEKRRIKPTRVIEESDSEESDEPPPRRKSALKAEKRIKKELKEKKHKKKKVETESEEEEEEEEEDQPSPELEVEEDDEDEEDEDSEEDDEYDDEEDDSPIRGGIELLISDFAGESRPQKPKKYKLNKEPENVRRFVKLVQTEIDPNEEDIDRDIGYFKGLTPRAQDKLLTKLQHKVDPVEATIPLKFQILAKEVPAEVERVALGKYTALQNIDPSTTEYYKAGQWIHGYTQLPLGVYKDLPVKLEDGSEACQGFVTSVRKHMDDAIYGHEDAKLQILQFVSSWIANPQGAGNVLSIHGPPGVGKTTLVKDGVAKALGRPFHFITLGGATDASFLDGHSYTYEGSTWGRIVDVLIKSKCMNPVIYFDELDKVSDTPKGEEINNLLIHLTDGSQNDRFQDKYFTGIDLDLSRCLFIFSHNNHERVNPILRDRMYNIQVEGFGIKEKLVIAENYLVSQALREVNLFEKIGISKDILTHIIEHYTGEEKGVRELKRCIQTVISKLNLLRFYNDPAKVPFAIKGFALPFTLKKEHVELFLKRKVVNESISHLYV